MRPPLLWLRARQPDYATGVVRDLPWETSTCCLRWCGPRETRHANSLDGSTPQQPAEVAQNERPEASSLFAVYRKDISGMLNAAKMVHTLGTPSLVPGGRKPNN